MGVESRTIIFETTRIVFCDAATTCEIDDDGVLFLVQNDGALLDLVCIVCVSHAGAHAAEISVSCDNDIQSSPGSCAREVEKDNWKALVASLMQGEKEMHPIAYLRFLKVELFKKEMIRDRTRIEHNFKFTMSFDASGETLGASLMQGEREQKEMHPVAYASLKLSDLEKKYSATRT
ncbi:hypothetical protein EVAR_84904_1 [Eumeta japonica]|uniref:Reverse transcriptase/retrotransposon-derived protein RNase H-like domain-containing protein n=1 Tax=Eumeta variegata TaxID=151549 RepID=A0A4C1YET5_EUMVA|nr:hypothetical protein EVAR_84904_1 [Eumeta japonica]